MRIVKTRYVAEGHSNRAVSNHFRKRKTEHCTHRHLTLRGAMKCAKQMQRREKRPWVWHTQKVVWAV